MEPLPWYQRCSAVGFSPSIFLPLYNNPRSIINIHHFWTAFATPTYTQFSSKTFKIGPMDLSDLAPSIDPKVESSRYEAVGTELLTTETLDLSDSEKDCPSIDPKLESPRCKAVETELLTTETMDLLELEKACPSIDPKVESPRYKAVDTKELLATETLITTPYKRNLDGIEAYKAALDKLMKAYAKQGKRKNSGSQRPAVSSTRTSAVPTIVEAPEPKNMYIWMDYWSLD
jgi:hypothetical protein